MRIKRGVTAVKKRRKIMRLSKGYFGAKSKQYRTAKQAVMKSLAYSYKGRKQRKRNLRKATTMVACEAKRIREMIPYK